MSNVSTTNTEEALHIVQGPLWTAIWVLTWPIMINMCAFAVSTFADTWVAGRLSADAQAAMGIGWQIRYFMMMLTMALEVGAAAIVSRYYGARDKENTIEAARQSLIWGGVFGLVSVCVGLPTCRSLLHLLGAGAGVEQQGWEYLKFSLVANIPATLLWTTQSIFRAIGDSRIAMLTTIVATAVVIVLDFVFCLHPFHMGIGGIGLSWIIATAVAFAWNIVQLSKSQISSCLKFSDSLNFTTSKEWFLRIMKIGLPGCMQEIALIVGSFGLFSILSYTTNSAINQAAWGVGWRVEELVVLTPMFAFNTAIAIIVGQNLGAHEEGRAEQAGWKITYAGIVINILVGLFFYFCAANIATFMSSDSAVVKVLVDYFHFIAWTEPLFAVWFILSGAMQGAGYTRVPMIITIICFCTLRLLLAWYLTVAAGYGANGTWIAMALSSALAGVLMTLSFKYGKWKLQIV